MDQKQRITFYIALCYFAMSAALFTIFISTYSYYFYKNQKQAVLNKAITSEEKNIKITLEKFRSAYGKYDLIRKEHDRMAQIMAKSKLNDLIVAINAESDPVPLPKTKKKEVNPAEVFIEDSAPILQKEPLLKPISKSELEKPFLDIFNKIVESGKEDVDLRRFTKGMEQLVDMSYIFVDKQKITFFKGDEEFEWEIRAYAIPYQVQKDSILEQIEKLKQENQTPFKRLSIFRIGSQDPIFKGLASNIDYNEVEDILEKSKKTGKPAFQASIPFESYQLNNGQEELQVRITLLAADPEMGLCLASSLPIFKSEWMQFSFFERNWQPILAFIVLAWIICPIVGWIAYRMASQFKFKFTSDLEGDEGEFKTPKSLRYTEPIHTEEGFMTKEIDSVEEDEEPEPPPAVKGEAAMANAEIPPNKTVSFKELAKQKQEHQLETQQMGADTLQLETKEINQIRANNIRKSTGEFNRHQDDESNTDYLAGVQSEVLKSLIKKLRED